MLVQSIQAPSCFSTLISSTQKSVVPREVCRPPHLQQMKHIPLSNFKVSSSVFSIPSTSIQAFSNLFCHQCAMKTPSHHFSTEATPRSSHRKKRTTTMLEKLVLRSMKKEEGKILNTKKLQKMEQSSVTALMEPIQPLFEQPSQLFVKYAESDPNLRKYLTLRQREKEKRWNFFIYLIRQLFTSL